MAVLAEAISVIIRVKAIQTKYRGGWEGFLNDLPNSTFCTDLVLARVGFLYPQEVKEYVKFLTSRGLTYMQGFLRKKSPRDLALVDMLRGPIVRCNWLEVARAVPIGCIGSIAVCSLIEDDMRFETYVSSSVQIDRGDGLPLLNVAVPDGWRYEDSISAKSTFISNEEINHRLEYLRTEDDRGIYFDKKTGKEMVMPRMRK